MLEVDILTTCELGLFHMTFLIVIFPHDFFDFMFYFLKNFHSIHVMSVAEILLNLTVTEWMGVTTRRYYSCIQHRRHRLSLQYVPFEISIWTFIV